MTEKTFYVEDRKSWKSEYGGLIKNLPYISSIFCVINSYIDLENKPLTIIDYGCAYGYYLKTLKLINPKHKLYGIEIALDAVNHSRSEVGEDRIFWQSCGEKVPLPDHSVDLILCFEMVEHIADATVLVAMFEECNRLLKNDGYVFIKTPNCSLPQKAIFLFFRKSWIFKRHPNPFSEKKLRRLIQPYLFTEKVFYSFHGFLPLRLLKLTLFTSLMAKFRIAPSLICVLRKV